MYHFDTSDQRKPQSYISCIALWLGRYDIALTTTAFDADAVYKALVPFDYLYEVLYCGIEFNMLV